ncbi:MAG: hypothetical protein LBU14_02795 [Candidatus Peribacteria bacterium]|nr:hypothetical protein [Candidatus Peribacteria bacterium]
MSFAFHGITSISTKNLLSFIKVSSILFATEVYQSSLTGFHSNRSCKSSHLNNTFSGAFGILFNQSSKILIIFCKFHISILVNCLIGFCRKNQFISLIKILFVYQCIICASIKVKPLFLAILSICFL